MIHTEQMPPIPANENPYKHDHYNMGIDIGKNITVMFEAHDDQQAKYLIIINKETGERMRLVFDLLSVDNPPIGERIMNSKIPLA